MARSSKPAFVGRQYTLPTPRAEIGVRLPGSFNYSSGKACTDKFGKLKKGKCLTQLAFKAGQPVVRFCVAPNKPGRVVPVRTAGEAARVAAKGCACIEKRGARKCFPGTALGGKRRKRRR